MSVVTSPFRSSFGPSSSNTNMNSNGQNPQAGSIYPSLPNQNNQLQRYGQSQPQSQSQSQPPQYTQSQALQTQQQQPQQQQLQQSTSFGPISQHQPQQPQQQQLQQQQPSTSYGYPGQQQQTYSTNAFTNTFSFGPQQLANPSSGKSEEEVRYNELSLAGEKVGRGMSADEEISGDLADMMANAQAANIPAYADLPGQSTAYYPFQITQTLPLPDELHTEMRRADVDHKGLTAKMGLFEEIGHAWFVVGSRLFLWNYGDTRDFSRYDEQKDPIEAVGLVKAKRDVFIDDITHILVICTRSSATILGISRTDNKLNFFQTELSCQVPTRMLSISGTSSGRVFMNGENKGLYELEYTNAAGWFFGSSSKIWVTGRLCVPSSFFPMRTSDGVESFVVDPVQNRIFTLHTKGEIRLSEASTNGWMERGMCSQTTLNNALRNAGSSVTKVISIAVVGANESRRYCLMAITENGTRIYLSTSSFQGQGSMGYGFAGSTSSCIARPPPQQMASLRFSPKSFYSSGAFIGVQDTEAGTSRSSTLHCYIPNPGVQPALRENRNQHNLSPVWQEWIMSIQNAVKDQVWTIAEIPTTNPVNDPASLKRSDNLALSALARQTSVDKRQFLILSESALSWAQVTRPVDMLQAGLEVDKDALTVIHDAFGRIQLAAMGVTLGSQGDMKQPDLASAVSHILTAAGGYPVLSENPSGRTITYSARHDGLVLTVARLLRPIWRANVTVMAMGGRQVLNIPAARLQTIQAVLQKLRTFLEQNPFPRHVAQGDAKIAWDQEEMSLGALHSLLKNVIEAISFLDLLDKYKLPDIVAKCDMDLQNMLSRMTFKDFLTTQEGRKISRQLVTNLIEQQIGQEHGIDTLSETLQRECGTFSQPGDVVVYKAEENLRRAEYSRDPNERAETLAESFRLFSKAAKDITPSKVAPIAKRYHDAGFTRGAIELPLQTAAKVDPNDQALDFMRDGMRQGDRRKELYEAREECYKVVTQALGELDSKLSQAAASGDVGGVAARRDEAYAMAINSDDELFHRYLYDWHVNRGLAEQLLEFDTPYIETYLQITASHEGQEHKDLLWKYYARREEYLPAARALHDLATRDQPPMSLNDRMYYLAQALTSAKSAASLGVEDVEFTSGLQERIDVAQVQSEVGRAIASHKEMTPTEKNDSLLQLDSRLLGLDDLYQNYARPFRLYEPILLILKTADTRIEDVCEAVWRQLLRDQTSGSDVLKDAIMRDRLGDLIRRYYPSEAAPLDIVLPVIYEELSSMWQTAESGWVTTTLLDAGVGLRDVWETVAGLYERGEEDREFLEEEAGVVFTHWLKEKESIPAAEVERFASNHLLRIGNEQLDERRQATRKRMSLAKDAAVRY